MKFYKIKNNFYILLCTSLLLLVGVYAAIKDHSSSPSPLPHFYIQNPSYSIAEKTTIFDADDGNYYVFLPSYTNMEQVTVFLNGNKDVSIAGVPLYDGMDCGHFAIETPYDFSLNGEQIATIWFYQSENIATMYIDTTSGSMEYVHRDINHRENVSLTLFTSDGKMNYSDENSSLKGRGNSTWLRDKRPYSLALSSDGDLLNMGAAANWVLLSNGYDETNLRNKLALDMAARVGLEGTPESRWVDVYLNGNYNGLYLLTEKIEIHQNRLNLDASSGDFVCKVDVNERWKALNHPFLSANGRTIEISYPDAINRMQSEQIEHLINQMEQVLLTGDNLNDSPVIDLDSWVRRYLIDEILGNVDSDHASSYFYCKDGKFFAGPVWDYDLSLGNDQRNLSPFSFIARNGKRSNELSCPYHSTLYENESFYNRMVEIYITEFTPLLQTLGEEIKNLSEFIYKSSQMNLLRWQTMFRNGHSRKTTINTAEDLAQYLDHRIGFFNDLWVENIHYCAIQFESSPGAEYDNIAVRKGSCLKESHIDIESTTWIDVATGQVIDFSQPIMTSMILTKYPAETVPPEPLYITSDYVTFLSIAVLLLLLAGFMIADRIRRHKERRLVNEHSRAKISSRT